MKRAAHAPLEETAHWDSSGTLHRVASRPFGPVGGREATMEKSGAAVWEAGKRALWDLSEVRRVNASLFPRNLPRLSNLAYAGVCLEISEAGGDYYDFFDFGADKMAVAVGDVSGKGIAPALVRATLQAGLRTLWLAGFRDLRTMLRHVNRLLLESTPESIYATLFLGVYDGGKRRLEFVNCGHPPPILASRSGFVRLGATATVLGFFKDWECAPGEARLESGETLLAYTDGATETSNDRGVEFGPGRLEELLACSGQMPVSALLRKGVESLRAFGGESLQDDLTLVALRALDPPQ